MQAVQDLATKVVRQARIETRVCPDHGEYQARYYVRDIWSICPECRKIEEAKREEQQLELRRQAREASIIASFGHAGIPERFVGRLLSNFNAPTPQQAVALEFSKLYAEDFKEVRRTGRSAIFIGKPGTGKTHLACGIAQHVIRQHDAYVLFITVMRAMRSIKDTWAKDSEQSESQAIAALVQPDLLILDEVGIQFGSDFERNTMFDILNERYERRRPTLFLSNLPKDEVVTFLGERVMDRLREDGGKVIPFAWDSYRATLGREVQ